MKTTAALLILGLSVPAWPATMAGLEREHPGFITQDVREALRRIKQAVPQWTSVWMRVSSSLGGFYQIWEPSLRVNISGSRDSGGYFRFYGSVENESLSFNASPYSSRDPSRGYSFWGGVSLSLTCSGSSCRAFGSVDGKSFSLHVNRFRGGGYSIWGQAGMSLSVISTGDDLTVNGSVDLEKFGKKSLAVLGAVLAVVNSIPAS